MIKIGNVEVVNSSEEKLLGVYIDSKLSFGHHVLKLCQKASNKLYAPAGISTKNLDEGIYYQSISILSFSLDVSQQAAEPKNQQNTGKGIENYI